MDIEYLRKLRKRTQIELIHEELFNTSENCKYHAFGIARGLYSLYDVLNKIKNKNNNITINEIMLYIKQIASTDNKINEYFFKLLKDIEEEN